MNAEAPVSGLAGVLKSLNCDRAYGLSLLAACALLALPELGGEALRNALSYDRAALAQGQWWRVLTAHFVHLDAEHVMLNGLGLTLMWALFARDYSPLRWLAIYLTSCLTISAGLWLLGFSCWILVATPFSFWPGGSVEFLRQVWIKSVLVFFLVAGILRTVRQCWRALLTIAAAAVTRSGFLCGTPWAARTAPPAR
jgi:hypothetical protein